MSDKPNRYEPEPGCPERLTSSHIGMQVLYRLANQAVLSKGTVEEISPGKRYVRIGRHWMPNTAGVVLSVLSKPTRRGGSYA